jgi:hypothetical protein
LNNLHSHKPKKNQRKLRYNKKNSKSKNPQTTIKIILGAILSLMLRVV